MATERAQVDFDPRGFRRFPGLMRLSPAGLTSPRDKWFSNGHRDLSPLDGIRAIGLPPHRGSSTTGVFHEDRPPRRRRFGGCRRSPSRSPRLAPSLLSLESVRSRILSAVGSSLHRKVEAGAIHLELVSGFGARIEKFVVRNPPGWETPALTTVDRLSVKLAFWPLLRRRVEVRRIELDGATVSIERDPSGRSSIADLLEARTRADSRNLASSPVSTRSRALREPSRRPRPSSSQR